MENKNNKGADDFDEEFKMEVNLTKTSSTISREDKRDKKSEGGDEKQMDLYSDYIEIKEFDANEPLISTQLPLDFMEDELSNKKHMLSKLKNLEKTFSIYRKVRSDGNSFYRALFFRYLEYLVKSEDKQLVAKFENLVKDSTIYLLEAGYEDNMIVEFQDNILENVEAIKRGLLTDEDIAEHFNDKLKSDTLVTFLRVLNSGYLRTNPDTYQKYLSTKNMMEYCIDKVESSDVEADETQMRSLAALLDTTIRVYNLVTFPSKEDPEELIYPDDAKKDGIFINIIHNPAGYHILYKGEMNI